MVTLEEAIAHAREIAECKSGTPCGAEHEQLADWLEELETRRHLFKQENLQLNNNSKNENLELNKKPEEKCKKQGGDWPFTTNPGTIAERYNNLCEENKELKAKLELKFGDSVEMRNALLAVLKWFEDEMSNDDGNMDEMIEKCEHALNRKPRVCDLWNSASRYLKSQFTKDELNTINTFVNAEVVTPKEALIVKLVNAIEGLFERYSID